MLPRAHFLHNIETRLQELPDGIKRIVISKSVFKRQEEFLLFRLEYCHGRTYQMVITFQIADKRVRQTVKSGTGIIRVTGPEAALEITLVESVVGNRLFHPERCRLSAVHDAREIHRPEIVCRTVHFPPEAGKKTP